MTHINDQELFRPDPDLRIWIAWGTVGWVGDPDVLSGLGKDEGDGVTLVKVTLHDGAPREKPVSDEGGANGIQVRVQPAGPGWRVPPKFDANGKPTRVMVGFANGDILTPGMGLILGEAGTSPTKQFGRKKVVLDYGDSDVIIKGKSVFLQCDGNPAGESDAGKRHAVGVDPNGGAQMVSGGNGVFVLGTNKTGDAKGTVTIKTVDPDGNLRASLVISQSSAGLMCMPDPASPAALNLKNGNVTITGKGCAVQTGSVSLGALASPATPVQVGPVAANGVPSTAVFCAP